jgi:hypothetical protein
MELEKLVQYDGENDVLMETFDAEAMVQRPGDYYALVLKAFEGKPLSYTLIDVRGVVMGGNAKNIDRKVRRRQVDASMPVKYEKVTFVIEHPTTRYFTKMIQNMDLIQNPAVKDIDVKYLKEKEKAHTWLIGDNNGS